jgi:hypothetical protein
MVSRLISADSGVHMPNAGLNWDKIFALRSRFWAVGLLALPWAVSSAWAVSGSPSLSVGH